MSRTRRLLLLLCVGAGLCLLSFGCGGPTTVTVHGRLTRGGQALTTPPKGEFQMRLYPYPDIVEGKPYRSLPANVNTDGTFVVEKVPLGKYLVAVQQFDPAPVNDLLKGAFTKERSKIIIEVVGESPVDIDLPPAGAN